MKVKRTVAVDTLEQMCDLMCNNTEPEEHEYCKRCGRRLKSLESRMLGYGNTCYKRLSFYSMRKRLFDVK